MYISYINHFRLDDLKKNFELWEGYENFRNKFDGQLNEAEVEFKSTVRIYNLWEPKVELRTIFLVKSQSAGVESIN